MKKYILYATLASMLALSVSVLSCQKDTSKSGDAVSGQQELYLCPMHPQITSDKPGSCSICGMDLVKRAVEKPKPAPKADKQLYICPMHPQITSNDPKYKCPICGMDLVEKKTDAVEPGGKAVGSEEKPLSPVSVSPKQRRVLGITFGTVESRPLSRDIRTSARIVPDETRMYRVTTKLDGYIDNLFVNVTGQEVKKGDPLLTIYSPELVASQEEFLTALKAAEQLSSSSHEEVVRGGRGLVESARRRLKLWDITDAQIARLEKTGRVEKHLKLFAPASGFVMEKSVLAGQKIMPGDPLLVIADLSTVWAEVDIYEADLPFVKVGMPASLTLSNRPGKTFEGEVKFLYPYLDPKTRTLNARLNIPNPELLLKPEMYASAQLHYDLGSSLAVPESALMRTGVQTYVFVAAGDDTINPVEVTVGARSGQYFEVISGLNEGDRVVTSANFLIDSESSLKAALQAITGGQP